MKTLYIDSHSTRSFVVGYTKDGSFSWLTGVDASVEMIEKIDALSSNEIDEIVINKGPGSLTGLRIGSSFAQGIALAKNIPILAISIWDLLLNEFPSCDIFFFTGTKKWIKKNRTEEVILEKGFESHSDIWISNKPELLQGLNNSRRLDFPNCIELMHKYKYLASRDISLLYTINMFGVGK